MRNCGLIYQSLFKYREKIFAKIHVLKKRQSEIIFFWNTQICRALLSRTIIEETLNVPRRLARAFASFFFGAMFNSCQIFVCSERVEEFEEIDHLSVFH